MELKEDEKKNSMIFIYTDIIEPQVVGDVESRCLRIINVSDVGYYKFHPIYYYPLSKHIIESIEILITDKHGEKIIISNSITPTYLILHIKRN